MLELPLLQWGVLQFFPSLMLKEKLHLQDTDFGMRGGGVQH